MPKKLQQHVEDSDQTKLEKTLQPKEIGFLTTGNGQLLYKHEDGVTIDQIPTEVGVQVNQGEIPIGVDNSALQVVSSNALHPSLSEIDAKLSENAARIPSGNRRSCFIGYNTGGEGDVSQGPTDLDTYYPIEIRRDYFYHVAQGFSNILPTGSFFSSNRQAAITYTGSDTIRAYYSFYFCISKSGFGSGSNETYVFSAKRNGVSLDEPLSYFFSTFSTGENFPVLLEGYVDLSQGDVLSFEFKRQGASTFETLRGRNSLNIIQV